MRVLKSLGDRPVGYRTIEKRSGYYNGLANILRAEYPGSLCERGLAAQQVSTDGRIRLLFNITEKGKELVLRAIALERVTEL
jgi:hypothetical protein